MVNFLKFVLVVCFVIALVSQTQASELSLDSTDVSAVSASSRGTSQRSEAAPSMTATLGDWDTPAVTLTLSKPKGIGSESTSGKEWHPQGGLLPESSSPKPVTVHIEGTDEFTRPGLVALNFNIAPKPGGGVSGPHFLGITPDGIFGESGEGIPTVPEPSTVLLLATGAAAAALAFRLRKRTAA